MAKRSLQQSLQKNLQKQQKKLHIFEVLKILPKMLKMRKNNLAKKALRIDSDGARHCNITQCGQSKKYTAPPLQDSSITLGRDGAKPTFTRLILSCKRASFNCQTTFSIPKLQTNFPFILLLKNQEGISGSPFDLNRDRSFQRFPRSGDICYHLTLTSTLPSSSEA